MAFWFEFETISDVTAKTLRARLVAGDPWASIASIQFDNPFDPKCSPKTFEPHGANRACPAVLSFSRRR